MIHFKLGQLDIRMDRKELAYESFQKSLELAPSFLEALEALIELDLEKADWQMVRSHLNYLSSKVSGEHLNERIAEAIERLEQGLVTKRQGM